MEAVGDGGDGCGNSCGHHQDSYARLTPVKTPIGYD